MGYSNGQVQSQSDSGKGEKGDPGLPGIGFNLSDDGNFDLDRKRLTDVAELVDKTDAATKGYVDGENAKQDIAINSKAEKTDAILRDGSQAMSDNLDMGDKRTINVETPIDGNDGATKQYVDDQIHLQANKLFDKRTDSYDFHPNSTFSPRGNFGGSINTIDLVTPSSQADSFIKDHQHGKVYQAIMNFYYGHFFMKNFIMTNNQLKPGNYTAIFELFSVYNNLFINDNSNIFIYDTPANSNYVKKKVEFITINNNYNKIIFQFEVIRNPGSILDEFIFSKSAYPDRFKAKCLFFHRVIEGFYETDFDHGIFNADPNQFFFIESLSVNKKQITDVANATADDHAVNLARLKSYTDSHQNNYHLQPSFTFYKNYGDQAQLAVQSIKIPNHKHHDLFVANKEGSSPGFGSGWAWVSIKMTNDLAAGTYTAVFEIFSATVTSPNNLNYFNRESLIEETNDDGNLNIITLSHDY